MLSDIKITRFFRATRKIKKAYLISHITQRAAGKEPLFIEVSDYLFMIWLLKKLSESHSIEFLAFCLMPNHVHLLLRPEEENLYDAMRDLFSRYAMRFNQKYERKGHLFGGPYRQAICLDDAYLLAASLYIHRNPTTASLCQHPMEYRWSSVRLFCDPTAPVSFVKPGFILKLLPPPESSARSRYLELLEKGLDISVEPLLEEDNAVERFRRKLAKRFPSIFQKMDGQKHTMQSAGIDWLDSDSLRKAIANFQRNKFSRTPETRNAKKYVIEQLIARGYRKHEIAKKLNISSKTVYNILNFSA